MKHSSAIRVYAAVCVACDRPRCRAGSGAVQAPAAQRPGDRRGLPHRRRRRPVVPIRANRRLERTLRHPGDHDRFQDRPRPDGSEQIPDFRLVLKPSRRSKFRFEFIPIKYESSTTLRRGHRLQRHPLSRRAAGQQPARVEGLSCRLRVRLHLERSRVRGVRRRGEVHRREESELASPNLAGRIRPTRRRPSRPSAASAASTSSRTSRSPASSPASSCRRN